MPPAERPCGRTAEAGKRSRSPVEENSTSSSSPSTSSTAPTTSSPGRSGDDLDRLALGRPLGRDPLHRALPGRQRDARSALGQRRQAEDPLAALQLGELRRRCTAAQRQRSGRDRGDVRQVEHADAQHPPAGGDQADRPAGRRRGRRRRRRRAGCGRCACGPRCRRGRRAAASGRRARRSTARRRTARRRPRSRPLLRVTSALRSPPTSTVRRGVPCSAATSASSSAMTPRSSAGSPRMPSQVGDGLAQRRQLGLQLLDLERDEPPQLHVEDVAGLQLGQPDLRDQLRPAPRRRPARRG